MIAPLFTLNVCQPFCVILWIQAILEEKKATSVIPLKMKAQAAFQILICIKYSNIVTSIIGGGPKCHHVTSLKSGSVTAETMKQAEYGM